MVGSMHVKDIVWKREIILSASRGQSEKQWVEGARRLILAPAKGKKLCCCHITQWGPAA